MRRAVRVAAAVAACAFALAASAQIQVQVPLVAPAKPSGVFNAFPAQNPNGPTGVAFQTNYPYPGQCLADAANNGGLFPSIKGCNFAGKCVDISTNPPTPNNTTCFGNVDCTVAPFTTCNNVGSSFDSPSQRTAGGWAATGLVGFKELTPLAPAGQAKFAYRLLNPPDYVADTTSYPGADYYEIAVHEAWGFQAVASAGTALNLGLFPDAKPLGYSIPDGMQWTGLKCPAGATCACPADASTTFKQTFCGGVAGTTIAAGVPLPTPIWGVGQFNKAGGPVTQNLQNYPVVPPLFTPGPASDWSPNSYIATWPSISIRAERSRPVVVKWMNQFPNNHVLCPHPEAADWPCSIDRTFMGVKTRIDPGLAHAVPPDGVNRYGSPQQPDNSWVTHLHGGEIPPATDGFAGKWFGNNATSTAYANLFLNPPFEAPYDTPPSLVPLKRPSTAFDIYTYPMEQEEATIWFHDHTLGKTHHNVIAGPAGFFPVKEPLKHGAVNAGACAGPAGTTCEYTWLDPVTEPRDVVGPVPGATDAIRIPKYDLFLAVQDRSFNSDGSINFSNGLGQNFPPPRGVVNPIGYTSVTNGVNPQVHPTWVPEYFGDHILVNGVLWPRHPTARGWYRVRIVDGSDSRCYTVGLSTTAPVTGSKVTNNVPFFVIGNDQGYLKNPVLAPGNQFTMCPGERYELLVNFGQAALAAAPNVYMTNSAPAPFPAGITPFAAGSPYADTNVIMRFDLGAAGAPTVAIGTCTGAAVTNFAAGKPYTYPQGFTSSVGNCIPDPALYGTDPNFVDLHAVPPVGSTIRQVYLNERIDGVTLAPMGMQLNGVPFEYKVTETPKINSREYWQFINLTVDAHPMHPHLVNHQIVSRQNFNVGQYKALLCGSTTCQPGPAPGGEMQVVPDVTPLLTGTRVLVTAASVEGGRKDATQAPPGQVTTIVADWSPRWNTNATNANWAPGTQLFDPLKKGTPYVYEDVTTGPYVWHCHINSHEDSEMMRTSLVVK